MLTSWLWFAPEFAVHGKTYHRHAVTFPNKWYRWNLQERRMAFSSGGPNGVTDLTEYSKKAMLVTTDSPGNPDGQGSQARLQAQDSGLGPTNDIPVDGLIGVYVLRQGRSPRTGR
jgi:hypothetical protein